MGRKRRRIIEIAVLELQPCALLVQIAVDVLDSAGIETRGPADDAPYLVALVEQELGQIRPVLASDPRYQRSYRGFGRTLAHRIGRRSKNARSAHRIGRTSATAAHEKPMASSCERKALSVLCGRIALRRGRRQSSGARKPARTF